MNSLFWSRHSPTTPLRGDYNIIVILMHFVLPPTVDTSLTNKHGHAHKQELARNHTLLYTHSNSVSASHLLPRLAICLRIYTHTHIQKVLLIRAVCQAWHRFLLRLISINLNCKGWQWETGSPRKYTRHKRKMSPEATGFRSTSLGFAVLNLIKRFDWRNARLSIRKLSVRFSACEFWKSTLHRRVAHERVSEICCCVFRIFFFQLNCFHQKLFICRMVDASFWKL